MGAAMWFATGVAAFLIARIIPLRRTRRWWPELTVSVAIALAFGLAATALDFGGWNEPDWRCGVFTALGALTALGAMRSV
jgi:hypothetical protein